MDSNNSSVITAYAIVKADGTVKRRRGGSSNLAIYGRESVAKNHARQDGESVVEATIDLSKAPVFIRGQKVTG